MLQVEVLKIIFFENVEKIKEDGNRLWKMKLSCFCYVYFAFEDNKMKFLSR